MRLRRIAAVLTVCCLALECGADEPAAVSPPRTGTAIRPAFAQFLEANCFDCHDRKTKTAGLALDDLVAVELERHSPDWEKVVRKLTTRQMPPKDSPAQERRRTVAWLGSSMQRQPRSNPSPRTFRRLNQRNTK
jgi:hypothetical protein